MRNTPTARGRWWADVTSSQRSPGLGWAMALERTAFSTVLRDRSSSVMRARGPEDALRPFASVGDGLRRSDTAVREWVGLAVYWLTGRSSELFPAPTQDGH